MVRNQVRGELHAASKLTVMDIALARLIARDRALPRGWQADFARSRGVSTPSLAVAISGKTWQIVRDPKPVKPGHRHSK